MTQRPQSNRAGVFRYLEQVGPDTGRRSLDLVRRHVPLELFDQSADVGDRATVPTKQVVHLRAQPPDVLLQPVDPCVALLDLSGELVDPVVALLESELGSVLDLSKQRHARGLATRATSSPHGDDDPEDRTQWRRQARDCWPP